MKHVLVTTDFSPLADRAIAPAADLARKLGAKLTLAHVLTSDPAPKPDPKAPYFEVAKRLWEADQELEEQSRAALRERIAGIQGVACDSGVARGSAIEGILQLAKDRSVDLIVISSQGRTGLSRIFLGSVAEELARRSTVPVLIWKEAKPPA